MGNGRKAVEPKKELNLLILASFEIISETSIDHRRNNECCNYFKGRLWIEQQEKLHLSEDKGRESSFRLS